MLKEVEGLSNLINNIKTKQPKQLSCISFLQQYLKDVVSLQSLVKEENESYSSFQMTLLTGEKKVFHAL